MAGSDVSRASLGAVDGLFRFGHSSVDDAIMDPDHHDAGAARRCCRIKSMYGDNSNFMEDTLQ